MGHRLPRPHRLLTSVRLPLRESVRRRDLAAGVARAAAAEPVGPEDVAEEAAGDVVAQAADEVVPVAAEAAPVAADGRAARAGRVMERDATADAEMVGAKAEASSSRTSSPSTA